MLNSKNRMQDGYVKSIQPADKFSPGMTSATEEKKIKNGFADSLQHGDIISARSNRGT
jgi:hypothetical protein